MLKIEESDQEIPSNEKNKDLENFWENSLLKMKHRDSKWSYKILSFALYTKMSYIYYLYLYRMMHEVLHLIGYNNYVTNSPTATS